MLAVDKQRALRETTGIAPLNNRVSDGLQRSSNQLLIGGQRTHLGLQREPPKPVRHFSRTSSEIEE